MFHRDGRGLYGARWGSMGGCRNLWDDKGVIGVFRGYEECNLMGNFSGS